YNTRNLPELLGMGAAIDFHNSVGPEAIHSRMAELREYFDVQLAQIPGMINHSPPRSSLAHQIVAVEKEGISATDLKKALYDDHGIDVRWMGSHGMNGVRISLAIYHSLDDVDRLIAGLAAAE
ncbi:MAG: aminotransferase class V-fold PLP-dependent enzyme, partial [Saprospiraceae bacterium]|nr:aminotransferase class V-fold PLP-dependent enzyme [Saprospiraceae bacterium]